MTLREYIENPDMDINIEDLKKAEQLSIKIIKLLKNKEDERAYQLIDANLEALYRHLDLDSFSCLINFYISNIELEAKYLKALHKEGVPKLIINLSKDNLIKDKKYLLTKLNEYNESKVWEDFLSVIDILIAKTNIDKLQMYNTKLRKLVELRRYEEALKECESLLIGDYKRNESINKIKMDILIASKKFDELEEYLYIAEYILDGKDISKGYIALAKNYEFNKDNQKAYALYSKACQLNPDYKMPVTISYKINGMNDVNIKGKISKIGEKINKDTANLKEKINSRSDENSKFSMKHKIIAVASVIALIACILCVIIMPIAEKKEIEENAISLIENSYMSTEKTDEFGQVEKQALISGYLFSYKEIGYGYELTITEVSLTSNGYTLYIRDTSDKLGQWTSEVSKEKKERLKSVLGIN